MEVLNSMVKYKVNLKFKDAGKPLNEVITEALKIEIQKKTDMTNIIKMDLPSNCTHYSSKEGSIN